MQRAGELPGYRELIGGRDEVVPNSILKMLFPPGLPVTVVNVPAAALPSPRYPAGGAVPSILRNAPITRLGSTAEKSHGAAWHPMSMVAPFLFATTWPEALVVTWSTP